MAKGRGGGGWHDSGLPGCPQRERGYAAFGKMERIDDFLDPIVERERKLMEALFAGDDSLLEV